MECISLICAQTVIADIGTNTISAINILEDSLVASFPLQLSLMVYISIKNKGLDLPDPALFLEIKLNDDIISRSSLNISFPKGTHMSKSIINIGNVLIQTSGNLNFSIVDSDRELKSYKVVLANGSFPTDYGIK